MNPKIEFLKESIKNLKTVGTVTRSSKYVCKEMISHVDFSKAKTIVEIGAGDGVITHHILDALQGDTQLVSFEVNEYFCEILGKINHPNFHLVKDSAEEIEKYLTKFNLGKADYIVSAVPFVAFPDELALKIVENCAKQLKPGGLFIQLHYSLLTKKLYEGVFGNVDVNFVAINLPPAFVLVSEKG